MRALADGFITLITYEDPNNKGYRMTRHTERAYVNIYPYTAMK